MIVALLLLASRYVAFSSTDISNLLHEFQQSTVEGNLVSTDAVLKN
jgi:hypothetical protein